MGRTGGPGRRRDSGGGMQWLPIGGMPARRGDGPGGGEGGRGRALRGLAKDAWGRPSDVQLLVVRHAAALYRACINNNEPKSQKNISIASGVTEVTIRNRCIGLRTLLE